MSEETVGEGINRCILAGLPQLCRFGNSQKERTKLGTLSGPVVSRSRSVSDSNSLVRQGVCVREHLRSWHVHT